MKRVLFLFLATWLLSSRTSAMQTPYNIKTIGISTAATLCGYALFNPLITYAHAAGHIQALKSLVGVDSKRCHGDITYEESQMPQKGLKRALCFMAGPLCGIATIYALSKLNDIGYECYAGTPLVKAIQCGLHKSFFNNDQNSATKIIVAFSLIKQLINFIPLTFNAKQPNEFTTDGYKILSALNIIT